MLCSRRWRASGGGKTQTQFLQFPVHKFPASMRQQGNKACLVSGFGHRNKDTMAVDTAPSRLCWPWSEPSWFIYLFFCDWSCIAHYSRNKIHPSHGGFFAARNTYYFSAFLKRHTKLTGMWKGCFMAIFFDAAIVGFWHYMRCQHVTGLHGFPKEWEAVEAVGVSWPGSDRRGYNVSKEFFGKKNKNKK